MVAQTLLLAACVLLAALGMARAEEYDDGVSTYSRWGTFNEAPVLVVPEVEPTVTEQFAYTINPVNNTLQAWWIQKRGPLNWTSVQIPGLNTSKPVMTPSPEGDAIFLLNEADGRIYSFNASDYARVGPTWVSNFICGTSGAQQRMTVRNALIYARCNTSIAVLSAKNGKLQKTFKGETVPRLQYIPALKGDQFISWKGAKMSAFSLKTGKKAWESSLKGGAAIASVSAGNTVAVVTALNSPILYIVNGITGKIVSQVTMQIVNATFPAGSVTEVSIVAAPTVKGSMVYGVAWGVAPLPSGADVFAVFALDISSPANPKVLWYSQILEGIPNVMPTIATSRLVYISDTTLIKYRAFNISTGSLFWWYYQNKGAVKVGRELKILTPWTASKNELAFIQGQLPNAESGFLWEQAYNFMRAPPPWLIVNVNF